MNSYDSIAHEDDQEGEVENEFSEEEQQQML
jgi:hypothetical protein